MTSNCFYTHCNTLSSKINPDAPPFIPNPNPIHNQNDTASIGSTRGKSRRHGQHHIGQTNVTDIRLKNSDSNDRGSRNNVNIGHLNINRILHKIHHIREIISQKHLSILAITETWLTQDISDGAIAVEGYRLLRRDRKTGQQGGGICLCLHHQSEFKQSWPPRSGNALVGNCYRKTEGDRWLCLPASKYTNWILVSIGKRHRGNPGSQHNFTRRPQCTVNSIDRSYSHQDFSLASLNLRAERVFHHVGGEGCCSWRSWPAV